MACGLVGVGWVGGGGKLEACHPIQTTTCASTRIYVYVPPTRHACCPRGGEEGPDPVVGEAADAPCL